MTTLAKQVFSWWLEGWKFLFYFLAVYIVIGAFLVGPVYIVMYFDVGNSLGDSLKAAIAILYVGVYLPLVTKGATTYLGAQYSIGIKS